MVAYYKDTRKNIQEFFILMCNISEMLFCEPIIFMLSLCIKGEWDRIYIHIYVNFWKDMQDINELLNIWEAGLGI